VLYGEPARTAARHTGSTVHGRRRVLLGAVIAVLRGVRFLRSVALLAVNLLLDRVAALAGIRGTKSAVKATPTHMEQP
jgi:hypothetical protein